MELFRRIWNRKMEYILFLGLSFVFLCCICIAALFSLPKITIFSFIYFVYGIFTLFIIPSILKNYKIIEESLRESKKRKGKEELWRILHPNLSMDVSGHSAYSGPRGYVSSPKSNKKP